jgi:hypothetical protein
MIEDAADAEVSLGKERLAQNDPHGAIAHFARALHGDRDSSLAKCGLAISYALCGRLPDLVKLVTAHDATPVGQLAFLHVVLIELVGRKAWDTVTGIAAAFAAVAHLRAIAIYYAGCAAIARHDHDAAWACFEEFKAIVLPRHREFPLVSSGDFNLVFRQACLIEPPDRVDEIATALRSATAPAVSLVGEWRTGSEGPVFLCCCDGRYFRRFAAELCQSLATVRPGATMHFHIAAPEDADLELARSLAARHVTLTLNITLETTPLFPHPVYYTCNRFLVAPMLLQRYGQPLLVLDADSVVLDDLHMIDGAVREMDFACFNTGRIEPASVFQATIMYFAASPGAMRLLDILGRLVLAKLAMPPALSWMLDQAALYSAIRYVEKHAPEITIGDLTAATGREMRSFIGAVGTMAEKGELMNRRAAS